MERTASGDTLRSTSRCNVAAAVLLTGIAFTLPPRSFIPSTTLFVFVLLPCVPFVCLLACLLRSLPPMYVSSTSTMPLSNSLTSSLQASRIFCKNNHDVFAIAGAHRPSLNAACLFGKNQGGGLFSEKRQTGCNCLQDRRFLESLENPAPRATTNQEQPGFPVLHPPLISGYLP